MIQPPDDRRPPLTPQLALRVAIVGSFALAMFAVIFFRLWYLQVLSGDAYAHQAQVNRVRELAIPAPRGQILDRRGNILVDSKPVPAIVISPPDLPVPLTSPPTDSLGYVIQARAAAALAPAPDVALYGRLARVIGMPIRPRRCVVIGFKARTPLVLHVSPIACTVAQRYALLPYATATIRTDVDPRVQYYLLERQDAFPGVEVQQIWLRKYPYGDLAAQLFGTVGPISPIEVKEAHYRGVPKTAIIGQSGLEWAYDKYLRGSDGADRVQVDSLGRFQGELSSFKPIAGNAVRLSLDVNLQRAGEQALQQAMDKNPPSTAGAFVALNPQDGEVYAMGSLPTFDPSIFTHPLTETQYQALNNASSGFPLINRAMQSAYPTGSTFKAITATAALQSGVWSLSDTYDDTGVYNPEPTDLRHNAGHAAYGVLDIVNAIKVSSDDFFYNLGRRLNSPAPPGGALQKWARGYGIGQPTGIDLPDENRGILPSPTWRAGNNKRELRYEHKHHVPCCTLGDLRPWSAGDNENLAVGQGDLEATPLQLAVAYAALENGGHVIKPHVGLEVDRSDGSVAQTINPPFVRNFTLNPAYRDAILTGLRDAASQPGGTSADVFAGFPEMVYGKTGTAERGIQANQSWYVCFVPSWATSKPILVVVTVEQGGFGAQAAAPAAREILSQWFFGNPGPFVAGASKTL
jgi:penicillin-binding protein 2